MGEPARGYTRTHPPFELGNEVAATHGARSERKVAPLAERLAAEIVTAAPWLARAAFASALAAWARAEARALLVADYLDRVGLLDEAGNPRSAAIYADRLESRAATLRARLGLDPVSFAGLLATFGSLPTGDASDVLGALIAEVRRDYTREALSATHEALEPPRE